MKTLYFGDVSVDKVIDGIERFPALNAFPDIDMELFDQNIEWMHSFYEPASKMILLSMHSYLIRTKTLNILDLRANFSRDQPQRQFWIPVKRII